MPPRWIEKDSTRKDRMARKKAEHDAWVSRHEAGRAERKAFNAELEADKKRRHPAKRGHLIAGTRALPALSDADLAEALRKASETPRHLDYPHLLILRERGFTVPTYGDDPHGRYDVPICLGDVVTDEGRLWLSENG